MSLSFQKSGLFKFSDYIIRKFLNLSLNYIIQTNGNFRKINCARKKAVGWKMKW